MTKGFRIALLATALGCVAAVPARAQDANAEVLAELRSLRAKVEALEAEVATLRKPAVETPASSMADAAPARLPAAEGDILARSSVSASENDDADVAPNAMSMPGLNDAGFEIETFGLVQFDASILNNPGEGINTNNLGYNGRARRLIFGFRGGLPGNFRYNLEFMLARELVAYEDVTIAWEPPGSAFSAKIGFFYPFVSLENLTSNRRSAFVERAQMNDAWALNRRIGASFGLVNTAGDLRFNAGVFNGMINNSSANTEWQLAARGVWSPTIAGAPVHVAGNYQFRQTALQEQSFLYQARPFTQSTNVRFVGTAAATATGTLSSGIASHGDQIFGIELAAIRGPLHVAGEAQYVPVDAISPGEVLPGRRATTGQRLERDPEFYSVYGEVGYWLTGETRGYRNGRFFRTTVLDPVDKGGIGAIQLVGRIDHLDLIDRIGGSGRGIVNGILNGGRQTGYQAAINYWPTDFLRFTTQYSRIEVTGGPSAGQADPFSLRPLYERGFGIDAFVTRAQIEF